MDPRLKERAQHLVRPDSSLETADSSFSHISLVSRSSRRTRTRASVPCGCCSLRTPDTSDASRNSFSQRRSVSVAGVTKITVIATYRRDNQQLGISQHARAIATWRSDADHEMPPGTQIGAWQGRAECGALLAAHHLDLDLGNSAGGRFPPMLLNGSEDLGWPSFHTVVQLEERSGGAQSPVQVRASVWMKRENNSPCELIRSFA